MAYIEFDINFKREAFHFTASAKVESLITGVFAPSGAGKTTFLNLISGLQKSQDGRVVIRGREVANTKKKLHVPVQDRNVGYVFQDLRLFPHLSVEKNIVFGIKNSQLDRNHFEEIIDILEIEQLLPKMPSQLSGGQKQRVAIARSLMRKPEVLLLDEPLSALDFALKKKITVLLKRLSNRYQIPVLYVSHDLHDILCLTSELIVFKDGKLAGKGNYYDLIRNDKVLSLFSGTSLLNILELEVQNLDEKNQVAFLSKGDRGFSIVVGSYEIPERRRKKSGMVRVILRPEDISLSTQLVESITIQNQVKGVIESVFEHEGRSLCLINIGVPLLAEITLLAHEKLQIKVGDNIYCLFKSRSIVVV